MRSKAIAIACLLALAANGGSACAMNRAESPSVHCTVTGADKLASEIGGTAGVCRMIESAAAPAAQVAGVNASVAVDILSPHAAVAHVTADGRELAERRIDISDRVLNSRAIETLAKAVADQLRGEATNAGSAK
jgi:hypothetical protein